MWERSLMTKDDPAWDFFLSYTRADRAWAEWIAWQLEEHGYRVLIQAWDFVPGSNWIFAMQEGVTKSARMIAVLSESYSASVYGSAEWRAVWARDPAGDLKKLITVRVTDCDRPGLLHGVVGIDLFRYTDESAAAAELLAAVKAANERRRKPSLAPPFPRLFLRSLRPGILRETARSRLRSRCSGTSATVADC
jgi:TIR domain